MPIVDEDDNVKRFAVGELAIALASVCSQTVYATANVLFEGKRALPFGDPALEKEVEFLQSTSVGDIVFENIAGDPTFVVRNTQTDTCIEFSNRHPTRGEIRAGKLREILDMAKQADPNQKLYDVIQSALRDPRTSDMVTGVRATLTDKYFHGESAMSKAHFQLYSGEIWRVVDKKMQAPSVVLVTVCDGKLGDVDLSQLYDKTKDLAKKIDHLERIVSGLETKGKHFAAGGERFKEASQSVNTLVAGMRAARAQVLEDGNVEQYMQTCNAVMGKAALVLNKHRGMLGVVPVVTRALSLLVGKTTNSTKALLEMKEVVGSMRQEQTKPQEAGSAKPNMS